MDTVYDAVIIGLGPAGATAARLLGQKGLKIAAIDLKTDAADSFRKPCGGLLAPDAQKALARFNLTLPKDVLVDPQIFAVRTVDAGRGIMRHYQRFYINIDRHKFDLWLASLIPDNVCVIGGARCSGIEDCGNHYKVRYIKNGADSMISAKYLVGADGSNSFVRKNLFPGKDIPRHISIQQWFEARNQSPQYLCVFGGMTDSYCWGVPKDGRFIVGGAFPKQSGRDGMALLTKFLRDGGLIYGQPVKTEACLVSMPRGPRDICLSSGRAFLIGEAAGLISPTSLEGISYALNSAHALAESLTSDSADPGRTYRGMTAGLRRKLLLKHIKRPFMYNPFLRGAIMRSGINAIDVIS